MTVRPAQHDDLPAILAIYNEAVAETTATYDYDPQDLATRQAWFEDHQRTGHPVFVAEKADGSIAGWSSLSRFHNRPGYRFTVENSVYVRKSDQGQGYGKALLAPLLEAGRSNGYKAIIALIDADNDISVRMHAAFGFEEVGLLKKVGYKFNRRLDVVYMELLLDPD